MAVQTLLSLLSAAAMAGPQPVALPDRGSPARLTDMGAIVTEAITVEKLSDVPDTGPIEPADDAEEGARLRVRALKLKLNVPI